jgi:ribosomal protein S27E
MGLPVLVLTRVLMVPFLAVCNMTACIWLTWSKVDTSSVDTTYGKRYTSKGHARHQLVKVFGHADTDARCLAMQTPMQGVWPCRHRCKVFGHADTNARCLAMQTPMQGVWPCRHRCKVFGHADTDANQRACLYDTKCLGHSVMLSTIKKSATSLRLVFAF